MSERDELIQSLSSNLRPVKPAPSANAMALFWLLLSAAYVVLITDYFGPVRPGAWQQMLTVPRFLLECALGLAGLSLLAFAAFRSAIPGLVNRRIIWVGYGLIAAWLLQYVIGLWYPTLPPSMGGKREGCWIQTMAYAVPPMLIAFVLTRRLLPLNPFKTTLCYCLVAGLLPALYMQLACMYIVPHILTYHVLPGLVVAAIGGLLGLLYRCTKR